MNTERLHAIAIAVIDDITKTKADVALNALVSSLQNQVNQPQQPSYQQQVSQHITNLNASLKDAPSNNFSPVWREALKELELYDVLGNNLLNNIQQIFQRNQITPSVALQELQPMQKQLTTRKASLEQIIVAFKQLGVGAEQLEPGECEVGVLVPRLAINNKLNEFANDLSELNRIFCAFSELTTKKRPGFEIRSISSSDLNVFLQMTPLVAASIAVAVERIVGLYKQILEIRKLHGELKNQGVPSKELKGISSYANTVMKEGIEKLTEELVEKYYDKKDKERRNELSTELRFSLNKIAKRIDKGYSVEIRVQPLSQDEQDASEKGGKPSKDAQDIQVILAASKSLEFLRLSGEPILTLPESQDNPEKGAE